MRPLDSAALRLSARCSPVPCRRSEGPSRDREERDDFVPSAQTVAPCLTFRDRVRISVEGHLAMLPAPIAVALRTCEAASESLVREDLADLAVGKARLALQDLFAQIQPTVRAENPLEMELREVSSPLETAQFWFNTDPDPALEQRGRAALQRLNQCGGLQAQLVVLPEGPPQAFTMGGDDIYLSPWMLRLPEEQLAAALAHERGHLVERHELDSWILQDIKEALQKQAPAYMAQAIERLAELQEAGARRSQEFCADARAFEWLQNAGYDPQAMDRLLASLPPEADAISGPFSSYPTLSSRRQALAEIRACRMADKK